MHERLHFGVNNFHELIVERIIIGNFCCHFIVTFDCHDHQLQVEQCWLNSWFGIFAWACCNTPCLLMPTPHAICYMVRTSKNPCLFLFVLGFTSLGLNKFPSTLLALNCGSQFFWFSLSLLVSLGSPLFHWPCLLCWTSLSLVQCWSLILRPLLSFLSSSDRVTIFWRSGEFCPQTILSLHDL